MIDVQKIVPIVQQAGNLVMLHFRSGVQVYSKGSGSLVTQADLQCEAFLKQALGDLIPGSGFVAEESGTTLGNEYTWVIDPVDGTKNFERGLPYFCISVALMHNQAICSAVIYAPALRDLFYAQIHSGAWLNGSRLTMPVRNFEQLGVVGVMSQSGMKQYERMLALQQVCASVTKSVRFRVFGAAALDLAYVAAGMVDVALFENLSWWDQAAGILLIQEAGGQVTDWKSMPIDQKSKNLLAGNSDICRLMISSLL